LKFKLILFFTSLLIGVVLCELFAGFYLTRQNRKFYVWIPGLRVVFKPFDQVLPGVSGQANVVVNNEGMRAGEHFDEADFRILTLGGSTTECLYLDQEESWPHLLEKNLSAATGKRVFVGNIGRSGLTSRANALQAHYLLGQYPGKINLLVLLVGGNDLLMRLSSGPAFQPEGLESEEIYRKTLEQAFDLLPFEVERLRRAEESFWGRFALAYLADNTRSRFHTALLQGGFVSTDKGYFQDEAGRWYIQARKNRRQARKVDEEPDLDSGLADYRRNLDRIAVTVRKHSAGVLFVTQPALWQPDIAPETDRLLWMGSVEGLPGMNNRGAYYSAAVLSRMLDRYNETLLEFCREKGLECVDLAARIPRTTEALYDDVHFNEAGARMVAEVLDDHLRRLK